MVLEATLFGPRYDRLLGGASRPGAGPGAVGLQLRTEGVGELLSADSLAATLVLQQACFVAAQVVRGRGGVATPASPAPGVNSSGQQQPRQRSVTSLPVETGLVLIRETAKELLQRGLLFTFLAAWLTDRAFEAGADDTLMLPLIPAEVYLTDAVRFCTAGLLTALIMPPVVNEAEALRLGVASNLALITVSQQQREKQQQLRERPGAEVRAGSIGNGAAVTAADAEGKEPSREGYDEGTDDEETDALLREYRLVEALGKSTSTGPPRLTYTLTLLRGVLRFGSVNLVFALTGNLAATLLASALPNLLLLAYVRGGPMVLLERPEPSPASSEGGKAPGSSASAATDGKDAQDKNQTL